MMQSLQSFLFIPDSRIVCSESPDLNPETEDEIPCEKRKAVLNPSFRKNIIKIEFDWDAGRRKTSGTATGN
ncbi:hypothetical protein BES34_012205 [Leptospira inadai serovar Lyme]|uniref:Uncharacterized protein n=1 Tax=Leptospira inadai serovar Lyme TaxID=293084 RepID=A0ABX4YHJ6_9LEPT|nr:hypothetical protein BES34_012205 [Leptospira inadai serovar Lyme]